MKKKFIFFIFFIYFFSTSLSLTIENKIIVKVGNEIITSYDLENEIKTYLIINKLEINQQNINQNKEIALKKIIGKKIKEKEIKKYNVEIFTIQHNFIKEKRDKRIIYNKMSIIPFLILVACTNF